MLCSTMSAANYSKLPSRRIKARGFTGTVITYCLLKEPRLKSQKLLRRSKSLRFKEMEVSSASNQNIDSYTLVASETATEINEKMWLIVRSLKSAKKVDY